MGRVEDAQLEPAASLRGRADLLVPNRFELVLLAARRAKQLLKGARPLVESDNKEIVSALREVAAAKVRLQYNE